MIDNLDVIDAFQERVARALDHLCFDRLNRIACAFEDEGYDFG